LWRIESCTFVAATEQLPRCPARSRHGKLNLSPLRGGTANFVLNRESMCSLISDIIWPALVLEQRLFSFWAIGFGLLVELAVLYWVTTLSFEQCVIANLGMNAASAGLGLLLIPLFGIAFDFTTSGWIGTLLMAVVVNAFIETAVIVGIFKEGGTIKLFCWLCLANSLSVGLAYASVYFYPGRA
jgi:hypothetical protein